MSSTAKTLLVDKSKPGHWRVTLDNPPINVIDDSMYDAFYDLVGEIETDTALKVVTFESTNPDFFIAHYSPSGPRSRFGAPPWIDAATRLAKSGVLSIAVIRGRVRGGGSEFTLGCDIRFASREKAIFGQPEVGTVVALGSAQDDGRSAAVHGQCLAADVARCFRREERHRALDVVFTAGASERSGAQDVSRACGKSCR